MIKMNVSGDWGHIERFLETIRKKRYYATLAKYGDRGVEALSKATPVDTGTTAASWRYEINDTPQGTVLSFHNDNVNNGVNIALIVNYGHATGSGVWVEGRNYIEPAIDEVFSEMADELWKEVKRL